MWDAIKGSCDGEKRKFKQRHFWMMNDNQKGTFCILGQWLCLNFRTNCFYQGTKRYIKFVYVMASHLVDMHCSKTTSNVQSQNSKTQHILNDGRWAVDVNNLFFPFEIVFVYVQGSRHFHQRSPRMLKGIQRNDTLLHQLKITNVKRSINKKTMYYCKLNTSCRDYVNIHSLFKMCNLWTRIDFFVWKIPVYI